MSGELSYSTTPASNTAINGIGIQGSNNPSNMDNALRQLMADRASRITRHVTKAAGSYTAVAADDHQLWRATGAVTAGLTAAATLGDGWSIFLKADGGAITVDPNSTEQINGATTLTIPNGSGAFVLCTGSAFYALTFGNVSGPTSSTDNTLPRFDGTAGAIQTSGVVVDDSNNVSGVLNVTQTSTDAGATGGPDHDLFRNSASPAAADIIGRKLFTGKDSAGNTETYVRLQGIIDDPTSTSEDGRFSTATVIAGTLADRWHVGAGAYTEGVTGGDKGAGSLNVGSFYIGNSEITAPATQADQETATSTTAPVTPGRQQFHPGHPKCWAWVTQSGGTPSLSTSYNITSITDTGSGRLTITIATDFSSANWLALPMVADSNSRMPVIGNIAAGSVRIDLYTDGGSLTDPGIGWGLAGFGDQA